MAQIQRSVVEPDRRNPISRFFHAKKDKATIAAWRSDLDRILHVFEVRSTTHPLPTLLTVHPQTELALHTHMAVSDVRQGVLDVRQGVANTHGLVSEIHRAVVKGQEGSDIGNQTVGSHGVQFMIQKSLQLLRLDSGLQF